MPPTREPWIKVKVGTRRSDKLASLADDSSRLGYIYALLEAKTQRRMGVFAGRAHLVDVMGRFGAYVDDWLEVGLIHVAPALCDGCAGRHGPDQLRPGEIVIHDYLMEQRDPTNAERQKTWRTLQAALLALEAAGITLPLTETVDAHVTLSAVTPASSTPAATSPQPTTVTPQPVTPLPLEHEAGVRNGNVTPHSRARGTTVTVTGREKNVLEEEGALGNVVPTRDVDDGPLLSDPGRVSRRGSPEPRPLTVPAGLDAATPKWRHPCTDYVRHRSQHVLVDGQAVCPPCEADLDAAAVPTSGAHQPGQRGLGL